MRYKIPIPRKLPDAAGLALLEVQLEIYRKLRGSSAAYTGLIRKEELNTLLELGKVYHFRGEDEKAIEVLEESAANRGRLDGYRYLAISYERTHRYAEAIDTHRRAIARVNGDAFHLGHLGRLLCLMGRDADALDVLTAGQKAAPYDTHIRARLASVHSRLSARELDDALRRPTYTMIVVLGDRANFSSLQTMLESLYQKEHKLILVFDSKDTQKLVNPRDDGRLDMKAWLRRHPGIEITNHAYIHRQRLRGLSKLAGREYVRRETVPWIVPADRALRGWTLKMGADLVVLALDRANPMFAEAYLRAANDAGYLICGVTTSRAPTALEQRLRRDFPVLRCVNDSKVGFTEVSLVNADEIVVTGDLALEPAYRPAPTAANEKTFDQIFPTIAGGRFVLYLADPAADPLTELNWASSLASRLHHSNRPVLRELSVVYRSPMLTRFPVERPLPDNLLFWPRPNISADSNTSAMLRVGIHRAVAVLSSTSTELKAAVLAGRPAVCLQATTQPVTGLVESLIQRCDSLGVMVSVLDSLSDGVDPLGDRRAAIMAADDLGRRSAFNTLGELLGHGVELLASGDSVDRVVRLLQSEFDEAQGGSQSLSETDSQVQVDDVEVWADAADRALVAAGSALRVAGTFRGNPAKAESVMLDGLKRAAGIVRGLERGGLLGLLRGASSNRLLAQLLGGIDFPVGQVQSALLVKAIFPDLTIYLVDVVDRADEAEKAVRAVFPKARFGNALAQASGKDIRTLDFVYTMDKRASEFRNFAPSVAISQSALSLVPEERALVLANRLVEWPVPFLLLSIEASHSRSARFNRLSAALRRSFRLSDLSEHESEIRTTLAVARPAVMQALAGRTDGAGTSVKVGTPRVGLGLVVYNGAATLAESLDSILAQTYWDFELIVVDNGSTDATLDIARAYADRDPRVIIYPRPKNAGAIDNFRLAVALTGGEYFGWASDHDVYDRVWLERMVMALDGRSGAVLAYPHFGMIDDRGTRVGDHLVRFDTSGRSVGKRMRLVTDRMRGSGSKVYGLYRRAALDKVRIRTTVWWDRLFLLELAAVGEFVQVNEVLWWRRYKGVTRTRIEAPDIGKFGLIPPGLSTKDTVIRQLKISFKDGRPPFLMRMATLANAGLLLVDLVFAPPHRRTPRLSLLPLAVLSAYRAVVRTKAFLPAEFQALKEYVRGRW